MSRSSAAAAPARLAVDPTGRHLVADGENFPLIIDTAWSAFADPTEDEWRIYLETRRRQGFTAVLVTVLPVLHDRVTRDDSWEPFERNHRGHPDFSRLRAAFFERARHLTRIAHDEFGLVLMITVLWNNYLEGTWGAQMTPEAVMPPDARARYIHAVADAFGDLHPIFVVGGDDHYNVANANAAYLEAIDVLRRRAPASLLTTHTAPRAALPDEIAEGLDFYLHQSGHNLENADLTWQQTAGYLARSPRKPLVNSEPPYELHGKVGGRARWTRAEVRAASWISLLAGSSAGIGYGAHGVWMWATTRGRFEAAGPSLEPMFWTDALRLPGALDISLLAFLFRTHRLDRLDPAQRLLPSELDPTFRAASDEASALVAVYLPYALDVRVDVDLRQHRISAWDLAERAPLFPRPRFADGATHFPQMFGEADQLIIAERLT